MKRDDALSPAPKLNGVKAAAGRRAQPADDRQAASGVIVKPVVNAIRIIRYLSQSGVPERAANIARHLAINPSTCFNILRTLASEDVVNFDPLSKTYTAGLGLTRLVEQLMTQGQRIQLAHPLMHEFAARFGVTATLWRRLGTDRIVLVHSESSPTEMHIDMPTGHRLPILMGASGRLFVPELGLDKEEIRAEFEQLRWSRPLSFTTYWREVTAAQRDGIAVDDGYYAKGVLAIAVPIRDRDGSIAFTISTVMIRGQRDAAEIALLGQALRDLGRRLATTLF